MRHPLAALLLVATSTAALAQVQVADEPWPTRGWSTSTPEAQGIDSARLAEMLAFLSAQGSSLHGIVLVRHGRLVLEAYAAPYGPGRAYEVRDVSHAVLSALVGAAVGDGRLALDREVVTLLPEAGPALQGVTLRHLLTMSSGLGAPGETPPGDDAAWTRALAAVPRLRPLGEFSLGDVNAALAQAALARATGRPAAAYAAERLFEPLGIQGYAFGTDPASPSGGAPRLSITPRDLAKIGLLYLRRGRWEGRQLVPPGWIEESTRAQIDASGQNPNVYIRGTAYGYLWWAEPSGAYSAASAPGEYLFVLPALDLVAVFTGNLYCDRRLARELMSVYVVPAVRAAGALPENSIAQAALAAGVKDLE